MYPRYTKKIIEDALMDTPVVLINGPRQSGKSTLAKELCKSDRIYYTLDDQTILNAALEDPEGFVRSLPNEVVLDEIQRAPELFMSLKKRIDENREPGQFLLTGSANIMVLPKLSDSLAGRIEIVPLMPLSEVEILGVKCNIIDYLAEGIIPTPSATNILDYLANRITTGGYPEPLQRQNEKRKRAWLQQYITTMIQRDVKTISDIDRLDEIPNLLGALTNQTAQLLVVTEVAKMLSIPRKTIDRYINILSNIYLVDQLKPWHSNRNKRLIKTPKIHLLDTGVACRAMNITKKALISDKKIFGHLLETFIYIELKKQATWSDNDVNFYYYRDKDKYEVDYILEINGQFIAIETKISASVKKSDFKGIERFSRQIGKNFNIGIVLYDGDNILPFGDKLWAVPISAIWSNT